MSFGETFFGQTSASEASGSEMGTTDGGEFLSRLSRRSRSNSNERAQFIGSRQEAVQDAVMQVTPLYIGTMVFGFIIIVVATYFEVKSVYVLVISYGQACDRPLWWWLFGHLVLGMVRELCPKATKNFLLLTHVVWTIYGFVWFNQAVTCKASSPNLFQWVQVVLLIATVFLTGSTLLPLTFYLTVMLLIALVSHGVISNQKAAREGTVERLQVVEYDPDSFAPSSGSADDSRPSGECCCCTEPFDVQQPIVRTPCGHYYHKECVGDWLKLARTCPLCRCDLEEALWGSDQP
jgi:hypothetical protein